MADQDIVIIGAGTYGVVIADLAFRCGYNVIGFLDDDEKKWGSDIDGILTSGPIAISLPLLPQEIAVAVAIGDNEERARLLEVARENDYSTPTLISPLAMVSRSAKIGSAVYLHDASHVWVKSEIGDGTILSPFASVAHHTILEKGCFVSTKASIGASIYVEQGAFFGIGSIVSTGVHRVGRDTIVGAGCVVIHDTESKGVYVGSPARLLRYRDL